jgi:hypothetical protein
VEVARSFWRARVSPIFRAVLAALASFRHEVAFRSGLAWAVLAGRVPVERSRRWWNRAAEAPVLIDVSDWTDERLIFSVLVWPPLESHAHRAGHDHQARVRDVKEVIERGSSAMAYSTRFDTDYGLRWDAKRGAWVVLDGHAFDGERLRAYSREGAT